MKLYPLTVLPAPTVLLVFTVLLALASAGCSTREGAPPPHPDLPVQISFLHTSDWHSRLLPYDIQLLATDRRLVQRHSDAQSPLLANGGLVQIGGLTRFATLLKRERARSDNVVWVDSGDCYQGAPIFNAFSGEVETRALSFLGADAVVIGNHEFDKGLDNLATQLDKWATYPVLAANYAWERDVKGAETMARITRPYTIVKAGGLKIGIIGMANLSSLNSIGEGTNSLGIAPLDEIDTVQFYINHLAGQVDLIGITSHMGLTGHGERLEDYEVIAGTVGLDFVFGGHLHVVLDPPQVRLDKAGRPVVLTHSGAFMKFLGRLDIVARDSGDPFFGYEVVSHRYNLFPIDERIPEDPDTVRFLEPYVLELNRKFDLTRIIAYAPRLIPRFGREKDNSELGNIAAEAMADRHGIQADFALTNTLGIRTDIIPGPITQDQMFNVFPFDNFVTKMYMSGREICEMMTFVTRRSAGRGCQPQAQFSDRVHLKLNCVVDEPECSFASEVAVRDQAAYDDCLRQGIHPRVCDVETRVPVDPLRIYEVAVNDYIAGGGSGFRVLKFNNTKIPSDISIRDAVADRFQSFPSCSAVCVGQCVADARCGDAACEAAAEAACAERYESNSLAASGCEALTNCFTDVARYHNRFCANREERDPRLLCDAVDLATVEDELDERWIAPLQNYCANTVRPLHTQRKHACERCGEVAEAAEAACRALDGETQACDIVRSHALTECTEANCGPIPDDCFPLELVLQQAGQRDCCELADGARVPATHEECSTRGGTPCETRLGPLWAEASGAWKRRGIQPNSDACECRLEATRAADAECRELACVIGRADDRLEARILESYEQARELLENGTACNFVREDGSNAPGRCMDGVCVDERGRRQRSLQCIPDLCAEQAIATGCDETDLDGIENDEVPN